LGVLCLLLAGGPAKAQEKFRARNFRVRVAVQHEVEALALQGLGAYQVIAANGRPLTQMTAFDPYFVQITRGQPGSRLYRLVLRELDAHQVDPAVEYAKAAKDAYGLPVKVLRMPARDRHESRIIVTLGEFQTLEAARNYHQTLKNEKVRYIYEDRARAEQGEVRLLNRQGSIVARDSRFLRLVPLDIAAGSLRLMELNPSRFKANDLLEARRYRGEMELTINEEGTLTAVNDLWIEYYLYSVVGGEIGQDAPVEALKAQAVVARSEAVAKIQRGIVSSSFFDFFDTPIAQLYRGKQEEDPRVLQAVDATRGEILVWNGQAVDAVYGHSCGGVIASAHDVWGGMHEGYSVRRLDRLVNDKAPDLSNGSDAHAYTSKPTDALCNPEQAGFPAYAKKYFRWTRRFSGAEFSALAGVGRVKDVVVERRSPSGRVTRLKIIGDRTWVADDELEIRRALDHVNSTFFTVLPVQDENGYLKSLTVYGAGFGHGVGMCQMGAFMMGKKGYNYRQILAHYFTDVKIRRLYR